MMMPLTEEGHPEVCREDEVYELLHLKVYIDYSGNLVAW